MYAEQFQKSLKAVEEAREANIAYEPARMTAKEKEDLLAAYHPDYKQDEFSVLQIGPNKGDKVPKELAEMLQAHSRITSGEVDLTTPASEPDETEETVTITVEEADPKDVEVSITIKN